FNTIQQLNSVLNSENADGQSDRGYSQQNIICSGNSEPSQISTQEHVPVPCVENFVQRVPPTKGEVVDYSPQTQVYQESYIQHAIQHPQSCGLSSTTVEGEFLSNGVTLASEDPSWDETVSPANILEPNFEAGDLVRYIGTNEGKRFVCGRKKLVIQSVADNSAVVEHRSFNTPHTIPLAALVKAK
ncbi:MAG: hypothetical protein WBA76_13450, partial [Phormidesmis sp.]